MGAVDTGVLDGLTIGLTVLVAAAGGLILARTPQLWLNDAGHLRQWKDSRFAGGPLPVIGGIVIAAAVATLFAADEANSADRIISALLLGLVAAATPFLITADVLVRRLPDRIVYPLSAAGLALVGTGSVLGAQPKWFTAFFAGFLAAVLFTGLHLLGRLLRARTMGLGDVKLAFIVFAVAGLFDPWAPALVLVVMMLIAGVWALIEGVRARRIRGVTIAFGPAMLSGMWLGSVFAPIIL